MKKFFKKASCVLLVGTTLVSSAMLYAGCGSKNSATNAANEIEILYWESGMGRGFLDQMKADFEAKYPEYKIYINATADVNAGVGANIKNGEQTGDTVDLYMGTGAGFMQVKDYLVTFDELLDTEIPGEGKKLKDKVRSDFLEGQTFQGKTYALPWTNSPMSIVYNKSVFDEMGYELPRTSDELADLAVTIVSDGQSTGITFNGETLKQPNSNSAPAPFIHAKTGYEYWTSILMSWVAQYEGVENYNLMLSGAWKDETDGQVYYPSINALASRGKLEAIEALEKAISPTGHSYFASNGYTHTEAQTYYLNTAALMMPNGAWLENEMKEHASKYEFAMMKVPVVSALGEKLGISERQLAELVSYVDSGDYLTNATQSGKEYNKEVVDTVLEMDNAAEIVNAVAAARGIIYNNGGSQRFLIPKYTNCLDGVKKFILYFYSDEGMATYARYTKTPALGTYADESKAPDTSNWSTFTKSCAALNESATCIIARANNEFLAQNSLITTMFKTAVPASLTNVNTSDRKTAKQIFKADLDYFQSQWEIVCQILNITESDTNFRAVDESLYK